MKSLSVKQFLCFPVLFLIFLSVTGAPKPVWGGNLKITMSDGTAIVASYFWEENGQIKFDVPGGTAGIPKSQVASIQEIVQEKEFEPEALTGDDKDAVNISSDETQLRKIIQSALAETPEPANRRLLTPEETTQLRQEHGGTGGAGGTVARFYGPMFNQHGNFSEMVQLSGNGTALVMRDVLSSSAKLGDYSFLLTLFDGDGKVLEKKSCEVSEIKIDSKILKSMGIREKLYLVAAIVNPDTKIKRFEISAVKR